MKQTLITNDGDVVYYGNVLETTLADFYFNCLLETIAWKHDEAVIFGKHFVTKRQVAWYGDLPYLYKYSGIIREALPWTKELLVLKELIQVISGKQYNSCLLNLYPGGSEGMAWHSDDEKTLVKHSAIASLSLGAERKFSFRHKISKDTVSVILEHGSLLVMQGTTQNNWHHAIPKSRKITEPRVNLTFRKISA